MNRKTILIVDDEEDIRTFLEYNLKKEGFVTYTAEDGTTALAALEKYKPDLVLLDLMLPGIHGLDLCKIIKEDYAAIKTKIIALTALNQDNVQIEAFSRGCDDYVNKPIKLKVLIARIKTRLKIDDKNVLKTKNLVIDKNNYTVASNTGVNIQLSKKEFEILWTLASQNGQIVKRNEIFDNVWGKEDVIVSDRTIDVYIRKLRQKIGDSKIKTVKGVGYKFEE